MSLYRSFIFLTTVITLVFSICSSAADGVIHFIGSVVDGGCHISQAESSIQASCYRDGKMIRQTTEINEYNGRVVLPENLGWTKIEPIGKENNLKLLSINYY